MGSITVGAYKPDYASLIQNDAGLQGAEQQLAAGGVSDLASRNAAITNALEQFGQVPDLAALAKSLGLSQADLQGIAGPDVAQLAKENTDAGLSTVARLAQANQDANRGIVAKLNARGILNSGETGYELDRQNTANRQALSDANQKLLGYLQQYQQGYVTAQQQRAAQLAQAESDAANRQAQLNPSSPGFTANFDHYDQNNHPVYRGQDGNFYNGDGTPYTPPPPGPPVNIPALPDTGGPTTYSTRGSKPITGPSIFAFK